MNRPLLSICIPTYNRSAILHESLTILSHEMSSCPYGVELIVSDNCSSDDTETMVTKMNLGCRYVRNETNLGMDRNFLQCISLARGKYTWILGDDDFLLKGALAMICCILQSSDIGLLHIINPSSSVLSTEIYTSTASFLDDININITFLSTNIFLTDARESIEGNTYIGTFLSQVPHYIAASRFGVCIMASGPFLNCGVDSNNNGGYNFAKVFFDNYLSMMRRCVDDKIITKPIMSSIKHSTFMNFYRPYILRSIIGVPSQSLDMSRCVCTSLKYYWNEPYYYVNVVKDLSKWCLAALRRRLLE